eukprot:g47475.t1
MRRNSHTVSRRSGETVIGDRDFPYTGTLEAVCNDSMPRLPGISNFTVYLYCNLFNQTTAVSQAPPDLRAACSDAAWYFSAVQEDLYWVQVCRQFYTSEFNSTICSNVSLLSRQDFNQLCAKLQDGMEKDEVQECILRLDVEYIKEICFNRTFLRDLSGAVFNYILDVSSLDHSEEEVQGVLSEAILLSSLLDNASFWEAFNPNASVSILQTIDSYLKEETDRALKNDLLNCFSRILNIWKSLPLRVMEARSLKVLKEV